MEICDTRAESSDTTNIKKKARNDLIFACACGHLEKLSSHATFLWDSPAQSHIFAWISLMDLSWQTRLRGGGNSLNRIHHAPPHPRVPAGTLCTRGERLLQISYATAVRQIPLSVHKYFSHLNQESGAP